MPALPLGGVIGGISRRTADLHGMIMAMERRSDLGSFTSVNSAGILAAYQRRNIQILCACMASFSITAAICAIYWFWMMKRNYRRDLVLMLILGDFYKSLWYLIHGAVNFTFGQVESSDKFCQVSGFMLQTGLAACDIAILFISMHMALQIFRPAHSMLGHDGLYQVRKYVFAIWIIVPCFIASLAFVNPHNAYQAQGAFCWLPIRPFWYRLALSWVPRYIVWIYVVFVAVRIYTHVGYEFKVFGQERDRSSSMDMTAQSSAERAAIANVNRFLRSQDAARTADREEDVAPDDVSVRPSARKDSPTESTKSMPFNAARRQSLPTWSLPFGGHGGPDMPTTNPVSALGSRSNPASRRGSHQIAAGVIAEDFTVPPGFDFGRTRGSVSTVASKVRSMTAGSVDNALPPIEEARQSVSACSRAPTDLADRALKQRRRAIQRQLRILFIYPIVYMCMWAIPVISHCMSYSDRFAQRPVFAISALSSFCQTFMGFADVAVFCWREKPWHHIPGSNGTLIGSFCFWRFRGDHAWTETEFLTPTAPPAMDEKSRTQSQTGLLSSFKRWSMSRKSSSPRNSTSMHSASRAARSKPHMRNFSGGSDRKLREAELAHERLALERADFQRNRASLNERRTSVMTSLHAPAAKEWFDSELATGAGEIEEKRKQQG